MAAERKVQRMTGGGASRTGGTRQMKKEGKLKLPLGKERKGNLC